MLSKEMVSSKENSTNHSELEHIPKILHVDDDLGFLKLFSSMFGKQFNISSVASGTEALDILKIEEFDAVLTDYEMPGMNGLELLKGIKKEYSDLPVIFYTGQGNEDVAREAFVNGVTDYFTKYSYSLVHNEKLRNSIKNAIEKKKVGDALARSQETLREMFENMSSAVAIYEAVDDCNDFIFVNFNRTGEKIENVRREDLIGKRLKDVFPAVEEFGLFPVLKRVWETGEPERFPLALYQDERTEGWRDNFVFKLSTGEVVAIYDDVTEKKNAEFRIKHLNRVLKAIRNVNQLVVREKDKEKLLQGVCDNLIETMGYVSAWIAIIDKEGSFLTAKEAGVGEEFAKFYERLEKNDYPECIKIAWREVGVISYTGEEILDMDCPLKDVYIGNSGMTTRVEHFGRIFGFLSIIVPRNIIINEEEKSLFYEVAGDIAYALDSLEIKEERNGHWKSLKEKSLQFIERGKELNCLYKISRFIEKKDVSGVSVDQMLQGIVGLIPPGFHHPEITVARFVVNGIEFMTKGFVKTPWLVKSDLFVDGNIIGALEVYYTEKISDIYEDPFLPEEKMLINAITERMGRVIKRKRTEKLLKREHAVLSNIIETSPAGVSTVDKDGNFTFANTKAEEILKLERDEINKRKYNDPKWHITDFEGKFFPDVMLPFNIVKRTLKPVYNVHHAIEAEHSERVLLSISSSPLFDENGNFDGMVSTIEDITQKIRMEKELLNMEKLESIGVLAGGIAHDFNNVLTSIIGNISLAKINLEPDEEAFEALTDAEKSSDQARKLTKQILTFAKGGVPVKKTVFIEDFIRNTVQFSMRESNVAVEFNFEDELWTVEIDEDQMARALYNIVINAQQATPGGGVIKVKVQNAILNETEVTTLKKGKYVKVSVLDQGSGIPEKNINKVFDPFFSTKEIGRGMGLTTAYSIIKKHEGDIVVDSDGKSRTEVIFYIPALLKKEKINVHTIAEPVPVNGRILVVDDERIVRKVATKILEKIGYNAESAKNAEEGIDMYLDAMQAGRKFDIVIMDLTMPGGMDGTEATGKILEIDPSAKIIVSSGYSTDPMMVEYGNYGFCSFLTKPYSVKDIKETISGVLKDGAES